MPIILLPTDNPDPFLLQLQKLFIDGYGLPVPQKYTKLTDGLINQTYSIDGLWILQHVNKVFGPQVNEDIAELTAILQKRGVPVPQMCRAKSGNYYIMGEDFGLTPGPWRIMTKLEGKTFHFVENIEQIRALARIISRFHAALDDCHYTFKHTRPGVHDFDRHYKALDRAIAEHADHRLYTQVQQLYEQIQHLSKFVKYNEVMACEDLRIIHGDPKISNFLFADSLAFGMGEGPHSAPFGENDSLSEYKDCGFQGAQPLGGIRGSAPDKNVITGVVDLDTMAKSRAAFDVGDAIRSWCNPHPEDVEPQYNKEYAREALGLYLEETKCLTRAERDSLPHAAPFITLELAMRFAKDALCEDYFGFNPDIGHGEHSLMRARAMYTLCAQMLESIRN